jgi:lipoyl(octanoyl) transferase
MRIIRHGRQPYPESLAEQEAQVAAVLAGGEAPVLILTEHPPVYTIGTSGSEADVLGETSMARPSPSTRVGAAAR